MERFPNSSNDRCFSCTLRLLTGLLALIFQNNIGNFQQFRANHVPGIGPSPGCPLYHSTLSILQMSTQSHMEIKCFVWGHPAGSPIAPAFLKVSHVPGPALRLDRSPVSLCSQSNHWLRLCLDHSLALCSVRLCSNPGGFSRAWDSPAFPQAEGGKGATEQTCKATVR